MILRRSDITGGIGRKFRSERRQPPEKLAFIFIKEGVTPIDSCPQRPMARQRGAPPSRQELEPVCQPSQNALNAKDRNSRRSQLQGERHSVQLSADRTNVASSGVAKIELTGAGRRPLDEELNRSVGDRCCGSLCVSRRNREGSKTVDMLSLSAEWLLRCRQNTQVSIILEEGFDTPGGGRCKSVG